MNKRLLTVIGLLVMLVLAGRGLMAQGISPVLVAEGEEQQKNMLLTNLMVKVRIFGAIAETRMTMTFYNPQNRQLAGELYFPLPEGATVSGYALDINGVMVDGVVVPKERARVVFEQLTQRRIDPGLVEWTKGNNFKTRVFPLPAKGSRTIMVRYISELIYNNEGTFYLLPMKYADKIHDFSMGIEVEQDRAEPKVRKNTFKDLSFKKFQGNYIAEAVYTDVELQEDLIVEIPVLEQHNAVVEKNSEGEYYFLVTDYPKRPTDDPVLARLVPKRIVMYWDASASRSKTDHEREFRFVKDYFAGLKDTNVTVDLVVFRNDTERPRSITVRQGDSADLIEELRQTAYDGGTQLGSLKKIEPRPDYYFLFTDGLSNFGQQNAEPFNAPLYVFSGDTSANHAFLHYLASRSSGTYFNLNKVTNEMILQQVGRPLFNFISVVADQGRIDEALPGQSRPVESRLFCVGKLLSEDALITINYGIAGNVLHHKEYRIKRNDAGEGELLQTFWAQKKIEELMIFSAENEEELIDIGKKYGLVTPGTSLIVLDNLNQYLEFKIEPPKTMPDMRRQYLSIVDRQGANQKRNEQDKISTIMRLWEERINWWMSDVVKDSEMKTKQQKSRTVEQVRPLSWPQQRLSDREAVTTGAVRGRITDEKNEALPGVTITATSKRGVSKVAITDADGGFILPFLTSGTYRIKGEMSSFQTFEMNGVIIPRNARIDIGTIEMRLGGKNEVITVTGSPVVDLMSSSAAISNIPEQSKKDGPKRDYAPAAEAVMVPKTRAVARLEQQAPPKSPPSQQESRQVSSGELTYYETHRTERSAKIEMEAWDPKTPYLSELKSVSIDKAYGIYLIQRETYGNMPAYFLDCADYFFTNHRKELGLRILSNIAEMELENAQLLRILGHRLQQLGLLELSASIFEQVLKMRAEEPQSWRDLGLVLADLKKYERAIELLNHVVMGKWDRFAEIEIPALMELNDTIAKAKRAGIKEFAVAPQLISLLDVDIRIAMTWDTDRTDIDLWVIEPTEEKAYYGHNRTLIGGLISKDFMEGYGPEEYMIKKALHGKYQIQANYYGSNSMSMLGPVTVQVDIFTNYGRPNEQKKSITVRLNESQDTAAIGEIKW